MKKIIAFLLTFCLFSGASVFAIPYDTYMEGRHEYTKAEYNISPGLKYTEYLTDNEKYGYQRSYVYEYTPMQGTTVIPSSGDYVYGTTSLKSITKELEEKGMRVVGGINGDFFSMTTGVPIGAMMVDGEILSSDNDRTALGFDADGKAFISKPGFVTKLTGENDEINIEHINKYPLEYSLYLLTDKFYPTTKTTLPSTEIILMPYSEVEVIEKQEEPTENEENAHETAEENTEENTEETTEETTGSEKEEQAEEKEYFMFYPAVIEEDEQTPSDDKSESDENEDENAEEITDENESSEDFDDEIGDSENVTSNKETAEGSENGEQDAVKDSETPEEPELLEPTDPTEEPENDKTSDGGQNTEVSDENTDVPEEIPEFYAKKYTVSDEKLTVGCEIKVVVKEIRRDSINSEIPKGCFVLCAENVYQLPRVQHIKEGDEFTLSVTANEEWYGAVHAVGNTGGFILKDGEYCDDVEIDHYPYANPRTAVGITADGRVIFYCVDGRQTSSGGLRIDQLSHEMKELGCVVAMNLDGGGSTTAYAALPGEAFSTLKNSPSGIVERKTANSLLFINTTERQDVAARFTFFPERPYVVSGGSEYVLPKPSATDENYHPIDIPDDLVYEYYTSPVQTDSKIVDGNKFVSGEKCGAVKVYIHVEQNGETLEYQAGTVFVIADISDFSFEAEEYTVSPFESVSLPFAAGYHTAKLFYDGNPMKWAILKSEEQEPGDDDQKSGEDAEETEDAENETEYLSFGESGTIENEYGIIEKGGIFTPKTHGVALNISAKLGALSDSVKITVDKFPFEDSFGHWSAKNLYDMYGLDLMQGEPTEGGFAFVPDRNMTKSEFLTVLARIIFPDIDEEKETVTAEDTEQSPEAEQTEEISEETADVSLVEETEETAEEIFEESADEHGEDADEAEEGDTEAVDETNEPKETEQVITEELEIEFAFSDVGSIPEWACKYYDALSETGLLELLVKTDENGEKRIYPTDPITRYDVLVILGALCDAAQEDVLAEFSDSAVFDASPHRDLINNAVATKLFEGYEDNTLRPGNILTRAEAATVVLRFYKNVIETETADIAE